MENAHVLEKVILYKVLSNLNKEEFGLVPQWIRLETARRVDERRKREHDRRKTRSAAASLGGDRAGRGYRFHPRALPARDQMKQLAG